MGVGISCCAVVTCYVSTDHTYGTVHGSGCKAVVLWGRKSTEIGTNTIHLIC